MRKFWIAPALLAVLLGVVAGAADTGDVRAMDGALTVRAGDGEVGYSVNRFLPGTITVAEGSTVMWEFPWFEVHIVAILAGPPPEGEPEVSPPGVTFPNEAGYAYSGEIFGNPTEPPTFSVAFPEAGSYTYFCPIHPLMSGTVNVVTADAPGIDNQLSADAVGDAEYNSSIVNLKGLAASLASAGPTITTSGGKLTYGLKVGGETFYGDDVMQFFPGNVTVKTGSTVTWTANAPAPHDIVMNPQLLPEGFDPFGTTGIVPAGGVTGAEAVASPIMSSIPGAFGPLTASSFSLTFVKPGTYTYMCLLHADQGMVGTVTVSDTPAAPLPPNTGSGLADGGAGFDGWYVFAGVLALAASVAAASVAFTARRG